MILKIVPCSVTKKKYMLLNRYTFFFFSNLIIIFYSNQYEICVIFYYSRFSFENFSLKYTFKIVGWGKFECQFIVFFLSREFHFFPGNTSFRWSRESRILYELPSSWTSGDSGDTRDIRVFFQITDVAAVEETGELLKAGGRESRQIFLTMPNWKIVSLIY